MPVLRHMGSGLEYLSPAPSFHPDPRASWIKTILTWPPPWAKPRTFSASHHWSLQTLGLIFLWFYSLCGLSKGPQSYPLSHTVGWDLRPLIIPLHMGVIGPFIMNDMWRVVLCNSHIPQTLSSVSYVTNVYALPWPCYNWKWVLSYLSKTSQG